MTDAPGERHCRVNVLEALAAKSIALGLVNPVLNTTAPDSMLQQWPCGAWR